MSLNLLAEEVYNISKVNGFHDHADGEPSDTHRLRQFMRLALITTEVSEAAEELRHEEVDWDAFADELSDIIIRVADLAHTTGVDLGAAVCAKVEKNRKRPFKHGKAF